MGIFAIHIHDLLDTNGKGSFAGKNPLSHWKTPKNNENDGINFTQIYKTYNPADLTSNRADGWAYNVIRDNIGSWAESAAKQVGR